MTAGTRRTESGSYLLHEDQLIANLEESTRTWRSSQLWLHGILIAHALAKESFRLRRSSLSPFQTLEPFSHLQTDNKSAHLSFFTVIETLPKTVISSRRISTVPDIS